MSGARIYVEGGGDRAELRIRCREGFHKLFEKGELRGRVPRIVPSGDRNTAYDHFKTQHSKGGEDYVALLVDSEDPVADVERTWDHLRGRDGWTRPEGAGDDQVFLMTTCMET